QSGKIGARGIGEQAEERTNLGGEGQAAVGQIKIIKWLDAETVAGEEQAATTLIPDSKSENAAQVVRAIVSPCFVSVRDYLRITARPKNVTARFEFRAHCQVVVNFSVLRRPDALVFIRERLMPTGEVNDAQTAHA